MTQKQTLLKRFLPGLLILSVACLSIGVLAEELFDADQQRELRAQQELINSFSEESLEIEFQAIVSQWLAEQEDYKDVAFELEFAKEPLLMDEQMGFKLYSNWDLELHVIYDWPSLGEQAKDRSKQFCQEALHTLISHPLGRLLIHSVEIRCYDLDHVSQAELNSGIVPTMQDYTPSEDELKLQEYLLDFTKNLDGQLEKTTEPREIKEVCLSKFGCITDKQQLYALITLYQSPAVEDLSVYLEAEGQTLWESMQSNADLKAALEALDINHLQLEFRVTDSEEYLEAITYEFQ